MLIRPELWFFFFDWAVSCQPPFSHLSTNWNMAPISFSQGSRCVARRINNDSDYIHNMRCGRGAVPGSIDPIYEIVSVDLPFRKWLVTERLLKILHQPYSTYHSSRRKADDNRGIRIELFIQKNWHSYSQHYWQLLLRFWNFSWDMMLDCAPRLHRHFSSCKF